MKRVALTLLIAMSPLFQAGQAGSAEEQQAASFTVHPIGTVERRDGRTLIVLGERYRPGLMGLGGFSHVTVVYWFHRNDRPEKRSILQVHPNKDPANPLRGVFSTRAPVRPNLIGISRCRILAVKDNILEVDGIDAVDGSPVLDLKN